MKKHPNKHIREAIEYAVENGWDVVETGTSGHAFCRLKCVLGHSEHQMSVWSTPRNPENHAKQIKAKVKQCNGDEL
ncbi:MAG: hypothetical protein Q4F77_00375 [Acinetobacter sp.]|uniref:hypothetical protein n=1 Tax=Acinetobacter sp. TaxID=472 RepID=UPI0026E07234|nr:hypothetical protein [Acinetobacter sp.]MDO5541738.1 hypothetical protein [Acinetobacter sp.]